MTISRRDFGTIKTASLLKSVDQLIDMVSSQTEGGKGLDFEALKAKVEQKRDPDLMSAFDQLNMKYYKTVAGISVPNLVTHPPIPAKDVKSVFSMLVDSKNALNDMDKNQDGELDRREVLSARYDTHQSLGDRIAVGLVYDSQADFEKDLSRWLNQTPKGPEEISMRRGIYRSLMGVVNKASTTREGKLALTAYMQEFLVSQGSSLTNWAASDFKSILKGADNNFFGAVFGAVKLSNAEVEKLVGRDSLFSYVDETNAKMVEKFGASFEESWLDGRSLDPSTGAGFNLAVEGNPVQD